MAHAIDTTFISPVLIQLLLLVLFTVVIWATLCIFKQYHNDESLPLLGHYFPMQNKPYRLAWRLGAADKPLVRLRFGRREVFVLNHWESIRTALSLAEIADRPDWLSLKLQNEADGRFAFRPYGQRWRQLRKATVSAIALCRCQNNEQMQNSCLEAVRELLTTVKRLEGKDCFVHAVGKMIFGEHFNPGDARLKEIFCSTAAMDNIFRIGCKTDCFPSLELFHRGTISCIRKTNEFFDNFVASTIDARLENCPESIHCLVDALRQVASKREKESEAPPGQYCNAAMDAFGAGLFTSIANALWAILLLSKHPEVQVKMREEIAVVLNGEKVVRMEHAKLLPYNTAVLNESLRFATVLPMAIPHAANRDVILYNQPIKKGTPILANLWANHRDTSVFPKPDTFSPDRFLMDNGQLDQKLLSRVIPFSTGMRRCPGEPLARQNLFLFLTNVVNNFQIHLAQPRHLENLSTHCEFNFTHKPKAFRVRMTTAISKQK